MKTTNLEETKKIAEKIFQDISKMNKKKSAFLITLSGDLGAGKTTLTQKIGEILEIEDKINSPTFVISKKYKVNSEHSVGREGALEHEKNSKKIFWKNLIHIDAYRLSQANDLELIGFSQEIKNPENLIILEWPEMVENFLEKENRLDIKLKYLDELSRKITW